MDNRALILKLTKNTDVDPKETGRLIASLTSIIGECLADLDNVALPGFGTFESEKVQEQVVTDTTSGVSTLVPPSIKASFKPGSRLKKAVAAL